MEEHVQSLARFLAETGERDQAGGFDNESARTLRVDVDGGVWIQPGAAIAYRGDIHFDRRRTLEAPTLEDALLREVAPLVRAHGRGRLFCGAHGSHAVVLRLQADTIVVAWPDLLAFEESLSCEPALVGHGVGLAAGGLAVMRLSGQGSVALACHGRPLTLPVSAGQPVCTDPHATVAWSTGLSPRLKTDISWRTAIRHGGHEPVQMLFEGEGFVVVQPFEDPSRFSLRVNPMQRLAALVTG